MQGLYARWKSCVLRGLTIVLPIAAVVWVVRFVAGTLDTGFQPSVASDRQVPGLGVLLLLVLATLAGILANDRGTRAYVATVESALARIPFVKLVHGAAKDFVESILGKRKRFEKPVLVRFLPPFVRAGADDGTEIIGFVTAENLRALGSVDKVAVYVPHSRGPHGPHGPHGMGGMLLIVPRDRVTPIAADGAAVMNFVASGGLSPWPAKRRVRDPRKHRSHATRHVRHAL